MNVGQLQEHIDKAKPLYFVCVKEFTVKTKDKNESNPSKKLKPDFLINNKPIFYKVPTVVKVYATDFDVLKNKVTCIYPLDFKKPSESNSYIEYGAVKSENIYPIHQMAYNTITREFVEQFISEDFVKQYPQILKRHEKLRELYKNDSESVESDLIIPEGDPDDELIED